MKRKSTTPISRLFILLLITSVQVFSLKAQSEASFIALADTGNPTKIHFYPDTSQGGISCYLWDLGNGGTDSLVHAYMSYQYPSTGRYNVCLTIMNSFGNKDSYCKTIEIKEKSNVSLLDIKAENEIRFTAKIDSSLNINLTNHWIDNPSFVYFWDFGDGFTSTDYKPAHKYSEQGVYLIKLQVRNKLNNKVFYYADVAKSPILSCKADFSYWLKADSIHCINKSSNATDYYWWYSNGWSSDLKNPSYKFNKSGLYEVVLVAFDSATYCMDYVSEEVRYGTVNCNASFGYFVDSSSNTVYFRNKSLGTSEKLFWVFGDGHVATGVNPVHKFTKPGYYQVSLTTKSSQCLDRHTDNILIGKPGQDLEADFMFHVINQTVSFKSESKGSNLKYFWNFGKNNGYKTSTIKEPKEIAFPYGYHQVCLTVTDSVTGKSNITCKDVKVTAGGNYELCQADFIYVVDSSTNKVNFLNISKSEVAPPYNNSWDFGDGSTLSAGDTSHVYTTPGYYKVRFTHQDDYCRSVKYALINVNAPVDTLKAIMAYNVGTAVEIKASGYPVDFVAITHGDAAKLKWDFGDGSVDSTTVNPTHSYTVTNPPQEFVPCLYVYDPITGAHDVYCDTISLGQAASTEDITAKELYVNVYPNPFNKTTTIVYSLNNPSNVEINIFSNDGKLVKKVNEQNKEAGIHTFVLNAENLDAGQYIIQFVTKNSKISKKVLLVK